MPAPERSRDELLAEMRRLRLQVESDAASARKAVGRAMDWRTYVFGRPLTSMALAAGLGYLLVPRGKPSRGATIASVASNAKPPRKSDPLQQSSKANEDESTLKTLVSGALGVAVAGLIRGAVANLATQALDAFSTPQTEKRTHDRRIKPIAARPR
ncbi:MAG: hypothetical protein KDA44_00765 [Planctomycetales bacterium]|nr:hypothetical protein [Planctomycetales bacterium]